MNKFTESEREYYCANYLALNLPYVTSPEAMAHCMNMFEYVGETFQSAAVKIAYGHPVGDEGRTYNSLQEFALYLVDHIEVYFYPDLETYTLDQFESESYFYNGEFTAESIKAIQAEVNRRLYECYHNFDGFAFDDVRGIKAPFNIA